VKSSGVPSLEFKGKKRGYIKSCQTLSCLCLEHFFLFPEQHDLRSRCHLCLELFSPSAQVYHPPSPQSGLVTSMTHDVFIVQVSLTHLSHCHPQGQGVSVTVSFMFTFSGLRGLSSMKVLDMTNSYGLCLFL
jgi:hypothetical protein